MRKLNPTVISKCRTGNNVELILKVDDDIAFFQGHFPLHPILPGVTQIHWAVQLASELLNTPTAFSCMEAVKFVEPVFPGCIMTLKIRWDPAREKLTFNYYSHPENKSEPVVHSSGRIQLNKS
ncbi:3-hydroxyacyl-ACP dehydratase FabZ family protein [Photobacterium sp. J15]|uniref:3-hydroxyacyl-ACP dehydratase FabZ family protein n=1 Tax=Photobacterium sp. J15 TaxID=265901 RepID=UPI0007E41556|nr:hypothetical protein [Photobacterium sp. J15]